MGSPPPVGFSPSIRPCDLLGPGPGPTGVTTGGLRWALGSHILSFGTPLLTPYLLLATHGSEAAGVLAACAGIVGTATMFLVGLVSFLIPRAALAYSEGGPRELRHVLRVATGVYLAVLGSFAALVWIFGNLLLVVVYGNKYFGHGAVVGVLALGTLVQSFGATSGIGLWAIDRPRANMAADVATLLVTLAVMACLLPTLGVLGAALGDLAGKSVGTVVRYLTLRRFLQALPQYGTS